MTQQAYEPRVLAEHTRDDERPVGVVLTSLWEKAEVLLRQEKTLALTEAEEKVARLKVELDDKLTQLKRELAAKVVAGAVLFASLLLVSAALTLLLAQAISPWLAALAVALVLAAGGFVLMRRSPERPSPPAPSELVPGRTIDSLKQDAKTLTETIT